MPAKTKLIVGVLSTACAVGLALWLMPRRSRSPRVETHYVDPAVFTANAVQPAASEARGRGVHPFEASTPIFPPSTFQRRPLTLAELEALFPGRSGIMEYDLQCYSRYRGNVRREFDLEEHPDGRIVKVTNSLGLLNEREVREPAPELRVLVTGDSHTDGVCQTRESYAALLEAQLLAQGRDAEVLNAGCGGYSFYNYLGALERYLPLAPDVLVVGVYGGNDFLEVLGPYHFFRGTAVPSGGPEHRAQLESSGKIDAGAVPQGFASLAYFARQPGQIELALQAARDVSTEIVATCMRHGVHPIFVYIPPAQDVAWKTHADVLDRLAEHFDLSGDRLRTTQRMADSYLAFLRSARVDVVDLRADFERSEAKLYWNEDFHIAVEAHGLIAPKLAPLVEAARPAGAQRVSAGASADLRSPGAVVDEARAVAAATPAAPETALTVDVADEPLALAFPAESELPGTFRLGELHRFDATALFTYRERLDIGAGFATDERGLVWASASPQPRVLLLADELVWGSQSSGTPCGALLEQFGGLTCVDATTEGYGPFQYLGALERLAGTRPAIVAVVWNGVNDVLEAHVLRRRLGAAAKRDKPAEQRGAPIDVARPATLREAAEHWRSKPKEVRPAMETAVGVTLDLRRRCRELGAELLVVYALPPRNPRDANEPESRAALDGMPKWFRSSLALHGIDVVVLAEAVPPSAVLYEPGGARLSASGREDLARVIARALDPAAAGAASGR